MSKHDTTFFEFYMQLQENYYDGVILRKHPKGFGCSEYVAKNEMQQIMQNQKSINVPAYQIKIVADREIDFFWEKDEVLECYKDESVFFLNCHKHYYSVDFKHQNQIPKISDIFKNFEKWHNVDTFVLSAYTALPDIFFDWYEDDYEDMTEQEYQEVFKNSLIMRTRVHAENIKITEGKNNLNSLYVRFKKIPGFPDNSIRCNNLTSEVLVKENTLIFKSDTEVRYFFEPFFEADKK